MNDIRDAKYFGARIGDKCWFKDREFKIYGVTNFMESLEVLIRSADQDCRYIENGEGITFEPPKKTIKKRFWQWAVNRTLGHYNLGYYLDDNLRKTDGEVHDLGIYSSIIKQENSFIDVEVDAENFKE